MGGRSLHHLADHLRRDGRLRECVMVERSQPMTETHTPTPWVYRPRDYDDWGWIRGADGALAATARSAGEYDSDEHRRNGTDPFEANAALIVEAVNSHEALKARIAELEANEKAYEEIIGPMTYRQVADRIRELEGALQFLFGETKWKSVDRDNMEFEGRVTCFQLDRASDALQPKDAPAP
jgi:hypothetical protein